MNEFNNDELADAAPFYPPLDIRAHDVDFLEELLYLMLLIRASENQIAEGRRNGQIGGPVHLGVGQEAIAVGLSKAIKNTDMVFGAHRSHAHLLALGSDLRGLFSEVLGKITGHSRGMGGSMHLWDSAVGFHGSVPIVAGTVSLAVGAGMAARLRRTSDISVVYLGDGACEEGVVHESLNLASIQKDPVFFVVENNFFASHMHISNRQPKDRVSRYASAHAIPYKVVDGNSALDVYSAAMELVSRARQGDGPVFLEAITYRWYGHVDWREDIDVGVNRSQAEVSQWRTKDPVRRLREGMLNAGIWSQEQDLTLESKVSSEISKAWAAALASPYPDAKALMTCVYSNE